MAGELRRRLLAFAAGSATGAALAYWARDLEAGSFLFNYLPAVTGGAALAAQEAANSLLSGLGSVSKGLSREVRLWRIGRRETELLKRLGGAVLGGNDTAVIESRERLEELSRQRRLLEEEE